MEHTKYRKLLERHLDGELAPSERERLFEHLETCEECRQMLEAEERLAERLSRIPRLVAPSDLRANILKEALHEREQLMHALDEESRYAKAVRGPAGEEGEGEEYPYFAGSARPRRRSLLRTAWVRYSPVAAVAFAILAGLTALVTADFAEDTALASLQSTVRGAARVVGETVLAVAAPPSVNRRSPTDGNAIAAAPHPAIPVQVQIASKEDPTGTGVRRDDHRPAIMTAVDLPESVAGHFRAARAALHQMARAASDSLPEPAEQATPITAAIVVKTPSDREILSLDPDDFGSSLRETAETRLGGSLTGVDQFAFEGRRYRCYTLRVSANLFEHHTLSGISRTVGRHGAAGFPRPGLRCNRGGKRGLLCGVRQAVSHGRAWRPRRAVAQDRPVP